MGYKPLKIDFIGNGVSGIIFSGAYHDFTNKARQKHLGPHDHGSQGDIELWSLCDQASGWVQKQLVYAQIEGKPEAYDEH